MKIEYNFYKRPKIKLHLLQLNSFFHMASFHAHALLLQKSIYLQNSKKSSFQTTLIAVMIASGLLTFCQPFCLFSWKLELWRKPLIRSAAFKMWWMQKDFHHFYQAFWIIKAEFLSTNSNWKGTRVTVWSLVFRQQVIWALCQAL